MGLNDSAEQLATAIDEYNKLESMLQRIQNVMEGATSADVKVNLISKVLEGH